MKTVWVIELPEAELLLERSLDSVEKIEEAAAELLAWDAKSVLIKGGAAREQEWIHDYWSNGTLSFWLSQRHHSNPNESGALLSTAIQDALKLGYSPEDAIVIAKMHTGHTQGALSDKNFPESQATIPYLSSKPLYADPKPFKTSHYLGLYPVVDSADWVEFLLKQGVKTIQLRIKERTPVLEEEMRLSIVLAKAYQATLFINDYWDLALKWDAEAVHLGQSDLDTADLEAIRSKGLLLGVSTYCYYEVARAHAICPSYIAIGPVYPTNSKELEFSAQGIEKLKRWTRTLNYPLVAIGGINLERAADVAATGVCGVALISAITSAEDPVDATKSLLKSVVGSRPDLHR